jgi:hypothetical protein
LSIIWILLSGFFFVYLWEAAYALEGIGPITVFRVNGNFQVDIGLRIIIVLVAVTSFASIVLAKYTLARITLLSVFLLLVAHSALWITNLGGFNAVQPIILEWYLKYDLPPQAMSLAVAILTSYEFSFLKSRTHRT